METLLWAAGTALVTGLFSYLVYRRKASGKVAVTDADELWAEAGRARRELRRRIKDLEANEIARRIEIHTLRNELTVLHFAIAGNVPQDLQDRLTEAARIHIEGLRMMLQNKQAEEVNGDFPQRRFSDLLEETKETREEKI